MAQPGIVASDLRGLSRGLRRIDAELAKGFRRDLKNVAVPVAGKIKARIPRGPGRAATPGGRGRHWAQDIRAGSTSKAAYIQWGRKTTPYAPWIEFGGTIRQPNRGVTLTRPKVRRGRYVWPIIEDARVDIYRAAQKVLKRAHSRAGIPLG